MPWQITPATIPTTFRCFELRIPDDSDLIAAVLGKLEEMAYDTDWVQDGGATPEETAEAMRDMIGTFVESECNTMTQTPLEAFTYWHVNAQNNIGNGVQLVIDTAQIMNHYARQNTAALNDEWFSQNFWLKGGHPYVFDGYFVKGGAGGICTWELRLVSDNSVLTSTTVDLYSAAAVHNFVAQLGHTFADDTRVYLRGKMLSKNAASSGYQCPLTCIMCRH